MGCITYNPPGSSSVGFHQQVLYHLLLRLHSSKDLYSAAESSPGYWECDGMVGFPSPQTLLHSEFRKVIMHTEFIHLNLRTDMKLYLFNFRGDVWFNFPLPAIKADGRTAEGGHEE